MNFSPERLNPSRPAPTPMSDRPPTSFTSGSHSTHHHPIHHPPAPKRRHIDWAARTVRIEIFIVLLGCAILLIAVSLFLGLNNNAGTTEASYVDSSKYQAVFLNGGAPDNSNTYTTYFGHITSINKDYLVLQNVFYLTNASAKATTSTQLTKLGCDQLHAPYDQMVINRSQIAFWENIQDSGKVGQAISQYWQKFPNGPKCTSTSTTTPTTPSVTPSSTTTP